jgi:DNA-binding MarR family transcriptional regulator
MTGNRDVTRLARSPYRMLKRAAQFGSHVFSGEAGDAGLTPRQYTVLLAVEQNDGISQTALVKLTGIDRSTLADLVARLMAQGYLQRRRSKDDGRTNSLRNTALGKKQLKSAQPGAEEVDRLIIAKIPPAHRKSFVEALSVLADEMDRLEAGGDLFSRPKLRRSA